MHSSAESQEGRAPNFRLLTFPEITAGIRNPWLNLRSPLKDWSTKPLRTLLSLSQRIYSLAKENYKHKKSPSLTTTSFLAGLLILEPGVKSITQAIADEVDREGGHKDEEARSDNQPGRIGKVA